MNWEPWSGCYKVSDGCTYCYYYGPYSKRCGQNMVEKRSDFYKPLLKTPDGAYRIRGGKTVATCFATDFFISEADEWRKEAWAMIKERPDLDFLILTKRIDRFLVSLPSDWGAGYDNVNIGCSVENQTLADYRLPLFLSYPIKRRFVACSPLLGPLDLASYLGGIDHVTVSGETGREARLCSYEWILAIRDQCLKAGITFWFKSTGSLFMRDGLVQRVNPCRQGALARELDISILKEKKLF
ncbi:MAG: DUF5131 family protein [Firmicutes bacterium]|nr:DUF5131 family protein [Bacillota bacterium]